MNIIGKPTSTLTQCLQWAINKKANDLFLTIVPILYNTAVREDIDPTLVVAQCAKETGYCKFGGVLNASFKNTCGLKTKTGGDCKDPNAHMKFKSWSDGAKAQCEHLALYAGHKNYPKKDPVDPRHASYLYGKCKTVESLSGNWAGQGYGQDIVRMMKEISNTKA